MDYVCSLDWGIIKDILVALISAGIPSIVAWLIYRGWNNQKGTEVIANEAKNVLIGISELQRLQSEIYKSIIEGGFNQEKMYEFKSVRDRVSNSAVFLGFAINSNQLSHDVTQVLSQALYYEMQLEKVKNLDSDITKIKMIDPYDALVVSEQLLKLSLYKALD